MQRGMVDQAERAYRIALRSTEVQVRRSAAKYLGFLLLWKGKYREGWYWHGQRFKGISFEGNQWRGDPLDGQTLTVWNDVGMGDAFQFVRYVFPLLKRGEKIRFAVTKSQINIFRKHLAWPISEIIDRDEYSPAEEGPHIPLMSLIPILDENTLWDDTSMSQHGIFLKATKMIGRKNRNLLGKQSTRQNDACLQKQRGQVATKSSKQTLSEKHNRKLTD